MAERPKKVTTHAAQDSEFDDRVRRLCERLEVPVDIPELSRWALIGVKLAINESELKNHKKQGAPIGGRNPNDQVYLDVIEEVMASQELSFDEVLYPVIERLLKESKLPHADRTTHPKRLRRLYKNRLKNRPVTLASILRGERDK